MNVKGGHLFEATVAAVGEFVLRKINTDGKRVLDPEIGLATMCFID
jgi:predicted DNA-binding protein with PD1-like motif